MGAYNKIYVASNFTAVVHDTIGADKQLAQQQAFQSVRIFPTRLATTINWLSRLMR